VTGKKVLGGPRVRNRAHWSVKLLADGLGSSGHEGVCDSRKQVDKVKTVSNNGSSLVREVVEEVVVELVVLEETVTLTGNKHDLLQSSTDADSFHLLVVGCQQGVDLLLVGSESRVVDGLGVVGDDTGILGVDELDDTVDEVSEVGEELGVVLGNKVLPDELGVSGLGTGREEVVTPDLELLACDIK
jgi:hypothetical protein